MKLLPILRNTCQFTHSSSSFSRTCLPTNESTTAVQCSMEKCAHHLTICKCLIEQHYRSNFIYDNKLGVYKVCLLKKEWSFVNCITFPDIIFILLLQL